MRSLPAIETGTNAAPASSASRAAPSWGRALPWRLRVPSGKTSSMSPSRSSPIAVS